MEEDLNFHERVTRVETKLDTVITNHLPHLQAGLDKVDSRVEKVNDKLWWILGTIILGFVSMLAAKYAF